MSGLVVIDPELSRLRLRPPKSDTLTPLNATMDSGATSKEAAVLPQTVSLTEYPVLSTRVNSRLSYGLLVVFQHTKDIDSGILLN